MNPFSLEGLDLSLETWRWLYLRQNQDIKVPLNEEGLIHLNTLVRHDLLVYRRGRFHLTDLSREVLLKAKQFDKDLIEGVPLSYKTTVVDFARHLGYNWIKGKTKEKKIFFTNGEMILFALTLSHVIPIISEMPLEMEVVVSQILKIIFAEGFIEVYPRVLQRSSFFEPGVIWFKGAVGNPISIKEAYYDLISYRCRKDVVDPTFIKISLDKDYLIVISPYKPLRYLEDIFAIISSYKLEGLDECLI